jgi:Ser/Thr protein kinase RdoA (MazF antagonist)
VRTDDFDPLLTRLAAGAQQYFGDARAVVQPVARFDRRFSALLRLRVEVPNGDRYAFLKVFKPRGNNPDEQQALRRLVEREYRATSRLHEALAGQAGLTALRPLAIFPDAFALVTEEVEGITLDRLLRRAAWGRGPDATLNAIAERIGRWVRMYQTVTPANGVLSLDERREYLDVRLRALSPVFIGEGDRQRVLAAFDGLAGCIAPGEPLVAIHADLCPANILVGADGRVTLLDFAMAKTGSRFHDVAHLSLHFALTAQRVTRRARMRGLVPRLLHGYDPSASEADPLFRLMLIQNVVCHVALLAERPPVPGPAWRWFVRHRWRAAGRLAKW